MAVLLMLSKRGEASHSCSSVRLSLQPQLICAEEAASKSRVHLRLHPQPLRSLRLPSFLYFFLPFFLFFFLSVCPLHPLSSLFLLPLSSRRERQLCNADTATTSVHLTN